MSQYLVLIYEDESVYTGDKGPTIAPDVHEAHVKFGQNNAQAIVGGNALQPTSTATTIRDGVVTDGPFAETKETLGGYYLIEAADLDEAIAIAKQVPAKYGAVEVRPVMVIE